MADATNLTGWLIMAFGAYCTAAGLGMALSADRFQKMMTELETAPGLNFITGLLVFTIGVAILLVHPPSTAWPGILVSIMGWGAAIEGLIFLAAPQIMWAIARPFLGSLSRIWGIIALILGLALIALGWCHI